MGGGTGIAPVGKGLQPRSPGSSADLLRLVLERERRIVGGARPAARHDATRCIPISSSRSGTATIVTNSASCAMSVSRTLAPRPGLKDRTTATTFNLGRRAWNFIRINRTDVLARPTGFSRADAIHVRIPIEGADRSLMAGKIA